MSAALNPWLERLAAALDQERQAILEHDVEALIRSTGDKLDALRQLEAAMPAADADGLEPRLAELSQLNHANGALLARRRREVNWALRHLGRSESSGAYDAHGQTNTMQVSRPLGVV
jgi:flagellar biosynthesis/type III secretory pathway chaperone